MTGRRATHLQFPLCNRASARRQACHRCQNDALPVTSTCTLSMSGVRLSGNATSMCRTSLRDVRGLVKRRPAPTLVSQPGLDVDAGPAPGAANVEKAGGADPEQVERKPARVDPLLQGHTCACPRPGSAGDTRASRCRHRAAACPAHRDWSARRQRRRHRTAIARSGASSTCPRRRRAACGPPIVYWPSMAADASRVCSGVGSNPRLTVSRHTATRRGSIPGPRRPTPAGRGPPSPARGTRDPRSGRDSSPSGSAPR